MRFALHRILVILKEFLSDETEKPPLHRQMYRAGLALGAILSLLLAGMSVFGPPLKSIHSYLGILTLVLSAAFLLRPGFRERGKSTSVTEARLSLFLIAITVLVGIYLSSPFQIAGKPYWLDYTAYAILALIILESTRRIESSVLPVVIGVSIIVFFAVFFLADIKKTPEEIFDPKHIYFKAFSIVTDMVYAFIILSVALRLIKIDKLFNFIAFRITHGNMFGASPGLYAICVSALRGAISVSARHNVAESGKHTIPMMKQAGYPAEFAGAIQAAAASLGKLVPPIMGVGAFIIVSIGGFNYSEVVLAALIPAFLLVCSLIAAVVLQAKRSGIRTPDLAFAEQIRSQFREVNKGQFLFQTVTVLGSFTLLFVMLAYGVTPAQCALSAALAVVLSAWLAPLLRPDWAAAKPAAKELLSFIVSGGRHGVGLALFCAGVGIVLFVLLFVDKQFGIQQWFIEHVFAASSLQQFPGLLKLFALAVCAALPVLLCRVLPTLVVFFVMVLAVPILAKTGVPELHAYLFVFYYAMLAGITSPNSPVFASATEIAGADPKKLFKTAFRLSLMVFILPFAWIYHQEILLDWSLTLADIQTAYEILAFLLAIIAVSASLFGLFRGDKGSLSKTKRWLLGLSGAFIVLFPVPHLMIAGVLAVLFLLIDDDFKQGPARCILRPTFELVRLVILPKYIPIPVLLTFFILILVYSGLFTAGGFSVSLRNSLAVPWLTNNFHFVVNVENCSPESLRPVQEILGKKGYTSETACSPSASVSISKKPPPGEFTLSDATAIEFNHDFFKLMPELEDLTKNLEESVNSTIGGCLEEIREQLQKQKFTLLKEIKSSLCKEGSELSIAYVESTLAESLKIAEGMAVRVHEAVFDVKQAGIFSEEIDPANLDQHFVVASVFAFGMSSLSPERMIMVPAGFLSRIFQTKEKGIDYKLFIKITNAQSVPTLKSVAKLFEDSEYWIEYSLAYDEMQLILDRFQNTAQAIFLVTVVVCFFVLLGGLSQLIESKRRLLVLMRVSGLRSAAIWIFLFILSVIGALISCILAVPASKALSGVLVRLHDNLSYETDWPMIFNISGLTILLTVAAMFILKLLYFSKDISEELDYVSRNT